MIGNTNPANAKEGIKTLNSLVQRPVFEKMLSLNALKYTTYISSSKIIQIFSCARVAHALNRILDVRARLFGGFSDTVLLNLLELS